MLQYQLRLLQSLDIKPDIACNKFENLYSPYKNGRQHAIIITAEQYLKK